MLLFIECQQNDRAWRVQSFNVSVLVLGWIFLFIPLSSLENGLQTILQLIVNNETTVNIFSSRLYTYSSYKNTRTYMFKYKFAEVNLAYF